MNFTKDSCKTVNCYYIGKKLAGFSNFSVNVKKNIIKDGKLADGSYYMQLLGKYIYPTKSGDKYYLMLSSKKPGKPYTVKFVDEDKKLGPGNPIVE